MKTRALSACLGRKRHYHAFVVLMSLCSGLTAVAQEAPNTGFYAKPPPSLKELDFNQAALEFYLANKTESEKDELIKGLAKQAETAGAAKSSFHWMAPSGTQMIPPPAYSPHNAAGVVAQLNAQAATQSVINDLKAKVDALQESVDSLQSEVKSKQKVIDLQGELITALEKKLASLTPPPSPPPSH